MLSRTKLKGDAMKTIEMRYLSQCPILSWFYGRYHHDKAPKELHYYLGRHRLFVVREGTLYLRDDNVTRHCKIFDVDPVDMEFKTTAIK